MRATIAIIAVSAVAAAALWSIVALRIDSIVLISQGVQGPLPLAYWAVVGAFAIVVARLRRVPLRDAITVVVVPGVTGHLAVLLADLGPSERGGYALYVAAAQFALLAALTGVAASRVRRAFRDVQGPTLDAMWLIPFLLASGASVAALAGGRPLPAAAVLAGTAVLSLSDSVRMGAVARIRAIARDERVVLSLIVAAAFIVRLAFAVRITQQTGAQFPLASSDGPEYDQAAWALASGTGGGDPGARWPRGYWTFVAAVYRLFGHSFVALAAVQGALCALTPALAFVALRAAFGRAVALAVAALVALSGTLVFTAVVLGTEGLFTLVAFAGLAALVTADRMASARRALVLALAAGLFFGLAVAIKPQTLIFALLAALWPMRTRGSRWMQGLAVVVGGALALAPFLTADITAFGSPAILGAGGAAAFDSPIGDAWRATGIDPYRDGWLKASLAALARPADTWRVLAEHVPVGLARYFAGDWFGSFDPTLLDRLSPFAREVRLYGSLLALVGAVAAFIRSPATRGTQLLLFLFVATQAAAPLLLGIPQVRYRVPSDPVLLAYCAYGAGFVGAGAVACLGRADAQRAKSLLTS